MQSSEGNRRDVEFPSASLFPARSDTVRSPSAGVPGEMFPEGTSEPLRETWPWGTCPGDKPCPAKAGICCSPILTPSLITSGSFTPEQMSATFKKQPHLDKVLLFAGTSSPSRPFHGDGIASRRRQEHLGACTHHKPPIPAQI